MLNNSAERSDARQAEVSKVDQFKDKITKFSWISGYNTLVSTRCKEWDNRELDFLEGFKFVSFVFVMISATSFFLMTGATYNTWKLLDFF